MGIFARDTKLFHAYRVKCVSKFRILGGTPNDSGTIERWLRTRVGKNADDEEHKAMMWRTLHDLGAELPEVPDNDFSSVDWTVFEKASAELATELKGQSFRKDALGRPCIESRCIKSGIKEGINALFAKQRWGPTGKGPKNFVSEHVFVEPRLVPLTRSADKLPVALIVGHPNGPQGPRSTLNYHEYVDHAEYEFILLLTRIADKHIKFDDWKEMWNLSEYLGHGACRSQGYGQYDLEGYTPLEDYVQGDCYETGEFPADSFAEESFRMDSDVERPYDDMELEVVDTIPVGAD
jgi:hypothetical protein